MSAAYVARHAACGGIDGAVVDNPEHATYTAMTVAKWIREQRRVESTTAEAVRASALSDWCQCNKKVAR